MGVFNAVKLWMQWAENFAFYEITAHHINHICKRLFVAEIREINERQMRQSGKE